MYCSFQFEGMVNGKAAFDFFFLKVYSQNGKKSIIFLSDRKELIHRLTMKANADIIYWNRRADYET